MKLVTKRTIARKNRELNGPDEEPTVVYGLCDPDNAVIYLNQEDCRDPAFLRHSFWHEYVHALKYANGETDHDEAEVDRIAGMLDQSLSPLL